MIKKNLRKMSHFQLHVLKGIAIYTEIVTELVDLCIFFHLWKKTAKSTSFHENKQTSMGNNYL